MQQLSAGWPLRLRPADDTGRSVVAARAAAGAVHRDGELLRLSVPAGDELLAAALTHVHLAPPTGPIAESAAARGVMALAARAATTDAAVLVQGPTGAGKEGLARLIHAKSGRRAAPFLAINCAALPEAMIEASLFGHARHAFTGANQASPGLFRAAGQGTLLLDEIGELPLSAQAKLLRALQEHEVLPVGGLFPEPFSARVIAATNRPLADDVRRGSFRADLYYRLAVLTLDLPPLAGRDGDILLFTAQRLLAGDAPTPWIETEAVAALLRHDWPGNFRELANVIDRARVFAWDGPITSQCLQIDQYRNTGDDDLRGCQKALERDRILGALRDAPTQRAAAARLGISERSLRYKLAALRAA